MALFRKKGPQIVPAFVRGRHRRRDQDRSSQWQEGPGQAGRGASRPQTRRPQQAAAAVEERRPASIQARQWVGYLPHPLDAAPSTTRSSSPRSRLGSRCW